MLAGGNWDNSSNCSSQSRNANNGRSTAKAEIINFLKIKLELDLSKCDLFKTTRGVDFLGYRHFASYTLLRKRTAKRIKKRMPHIFNKFINKKLSMDKARSCIDSTLGWINWANSHNFKETLELEIMRELVLGK